MIWEMEKHQFIVPFIDAFIGRFLYVPWTGIKPAILVYWDDSLVNRATQPGLLKSLPALVCVTQLVGVLSASHRALGSIPSQGMCDPQPVGAVLLSSIDVPLSPFFSPLLFLKQTNEQTKTMEKCPWVRI